MKALDYWVVDAFTTTLFSGNPAAVLLPPAPLPERLMQQIAAENNVSETAFAVREDGGFHLRWFTPTVEVDLCGHATLATSHVLSTLGEAGPFRYRTRSGLLIARRAGGDIELDFPARAYSEVAATDDIAGALGVRPVCVLQSADLIAVLDSAETVAALRPDISAIGRLPGGAVIVTALGGQNADITSRYFAPAYGIAEDPVTGSLHTQVVPYWTERLEQQTLVCHQASARGGWMTCSLVGDRVRLRGAATLYARGQVFLPDI